MKVRALRATTVRVQDEQVHFEAGEVKDLEPHEAALAIVNAGWDLKLREFPLKFEGTVPLWPGSLVTWASANRLEGPAAVLMCADIAGEPWVLVMDWVRQQGHLVRQKDVLDANPFNVLASLFLVIQHPEDDRRHRAALEILTNLLHSIREDDQEQGPG
ncbi:MAG: hypothetical protein HOP32_06965 [Nitrospira sp.]|nr:hypothetical protein [Nitrospira sp.]